MISKINSLLGFRSGSSAMRYVALLSLLTFMVFNVQTAQAASVDPVLVPGNPECDCGEYEFKIETGSEVQNGTYTDPATGVVFTISGTRPYFDFVIEGGTACAVIAKGGPNANVYYYEPPVSADQGLSAPINPSNNKPYGLSHVTFCYTPGAPSIDVSKLCLAQTVEFDTVYTQNMVRITNDGDFDLFNIELKETIMDLTCAITAVDGTAVGPVPLPTGTWVQVPNGGGFTGTLAPGEFVDVNVECHDGALNLANTIKAKAQWDEGEVKDTATNDPTNECPFSPDPMVKIKKSCPDPNSVRLIQKDGHLAVMVCPEIWVKNKSDTEILDEVIVSDLLIEALAAGVDVGPLDPGEKVRLAADLGYDLCYLPAAPQQENINGMEGEYEYATCRASFLNTATVQATGLFGGEAFDQDSTGAGECELCPEECPR